MGLNNIQLPASLIVSLYQNSLIEQQAAVPHKVAMALPAKNKPVAYLGKNQRHIVLLVQYPDEIYLPEEQLNFLTSILQACHLNLGDVAIVNYSSQALSLEEINQQFHCLYLLIFGVRLSSPLLQQLPEFTVQLIDGCHVVFSPVLEQLHHPGPESKLLKSKLWLCLKQLFGVG